MLESTARIAGRFGFLVDDPGLTALCVSTYIVDMRRRGCEQESVPEVGSPPRGLAVEQLETEGEELALFQWEIAIPHDEPAPRLTDAEQAVLHLVVTGASNADIARARGSSVRTVANQVASLLDKLEAESRFELVRRYGRTHAAQRTT